MRIRVEDVKGFLQSKGYLWDGEIISGVERRKAIDEDFNQWYTTVSVILGIESLNECFWQDIRLTSTVFEFISEVNDRTRVDKDFSPAWRKYLLQNRTEEYAPYLDEWCDHKLAKLRRDYQSKKYRLNQRVNELKDKTRKEASVYVQLKDEIKKALENGKKQ